MKPFSLSLLVVALVSVAQPVQAASWVDDLTRWFTGLFEPRPSPVPTAAVISTTTATADSLRGTPLGIFLTEIPRADTLSGLMNWPYVSVNVDADLDRYNRLLRRTTLLTDPPINCRCAPRPSG